VKKKVATRKAGTPSPRLDNIDEIQAAWQRAAPGLDTSPIGILGRIYRIANLASGPISKVFVGRGLERGEFDVLATLYRSGAPHELTPTELYRQLMISSGGLTHRLKRLEDAGFITRAKSEADGRSSKVCLTDEGRECVLAAYREDLKLEARLLHGLAPGDRAKLVESLRALHLLVLRNIEALD
jgi:DNA-binding MarR family transcriptional regulator